MFCLRILSLYPKILIQVAVVGQKSGKVLAATACTAIALRTWQLLTGERHSYTMLQGQRKVLSDKIGFSNALPFTNAILTAIARTIARTNWFSGGDRYLWKYFVGKLGNGVSLVQMHGAR
jgi:hypothetical protein